MCETPEKVEGLEERVNSMGIPLTTAQWSAIRSRLKKDRDFVVEKLNKIKTPGYMQVNQSINDLIAKIKK